MRELVFIFVYLIAAALSFYLLMWFRNVVVPKIESNIQVPESSFWYSFKEDFKNQIDQILYYFPFFIIAMGVIMIIIYIFSRQPESQVRWVRL